MSKPAANSVIIQKLESSNKKHDNKHNKTLESDSGITEDMQLIIELYKASVTGTLANLVLSRISTSTGPSFLYRNTYKRMINQANIKFEIYNLRP